MAEILLSPAAQLAWQIGGDLALHNREPFIEPKHLLFGICSIEKIVASGDKAWFKNSEEACDD